MLRLISIEGSFMHKVFDSVLAMKIALGLVETSIFVSEEEGMCRINRYCCIVSYILNPYIPN